MKKASNIFTLLRFRSYRSSCATTPPPTNAPLKPLLSANFPAKFWLNCPEFVFLMLPVFDRSSSESIEPLRKPKTTDKLNSIHSYLSLQHPRTWLILALLLLQILLVLLVRSVPISITRSRKQFPAPQTLALASASVAGDILCASGKVYVYDLPPIFNTELLQRCNELNPWVSACETISNNGFGRKATVLAGVVPEKLTHSWYWTDQFATEIIYHNRIMNYRCRTTEPESASAFYIPFYAGLAVGKYLWKNDGHSAEDRDRHCKMMLKWVENQPYWNRSNGWDHFISMGRISWDFRRSKDEDWGSSCIYLPGMRNITRLLIERNPWDYFEVGVPYPTGFHPMTASDVTTWQDFVRARVRTTLYCFAGATRGFIENDFRGLLLSQCYNDSGSCRVVDCGGSKCSNGTSAILETFMESNFCLQPRGDSYTRRSIFDCMLAGSIPIFFWKRTAYDQYEWFLPGEPASYSVFIDRNAVRNGTTVREVLEKFSREEVRRMREKVIDYIPNIVYAKPNEDGVVGVRDAFDVAIEGVLKRIKEQGGGGYKW